MQGPKKQVAPGLSPEAMQYYIDHPVEFTEDMILRLTPQERKANKVWRRVEPEGKEIMNAVAKHNRVAVRSGHGISKTWSTAALALWFLYTRPYAKVIITGPKFDQLKNTIWSQIGLHYANSGAFSDEYEFGSERLTRQPTKDHPEYPHSWAAWIVTAKAPESLQGLHSEHMLVIADEASAEELDKIQEALMSCLTSGADNRYLMIGNPTRNVGAFYDVFHSKQKFWKLLHFNSENSAIVSQQWLEEKRELHHPDSPVYMVRVKGEFPPSNPRAVISLSDINTAMDREVEPGKFIELGVDPAFEGDDLATIAVRIGMKGTELQAYPKATPQELYRHVINTVRKWRDSTGIKSKTRIKVDAHGGYGTALIESLSLNADDNVEPVPIYSNAASTNKEYKNYITQLWFEFNAALGDMELPKDELMAEELCGREWTPGDQTTIAIEPKRRFKSRLGRSPDRADAWILAFAGGDKKVFARDNYDSASITAFPIDWNAENTFAVGYTGAVMVDVLHHAAIVVSKDLTVYGLAAIYEYYRDRLWIYAEFKLPVPVAQDILRILRTSCRLGQYTDARNVRIIGNDLMHKDSGDRNSIATILRRECGVNVREAVRYDEFGALSLGAQMFDSQKVTIHTDCKMARMQLNMWSIKTKIDDTEMGFGKALLLILSEVRRLARPQEAMKKMPDYRKVTMTPVGGDTKNPNRWMGR